MERPLAGMLRTLGTDSRRHHFLRSVLPKKTRKKEEMNYHQMGREESVLSVQITRATARDG